MSNADPAASYALFTGRFSEALARGFADLAGIAGQAEPAKPAGQTDLARMGGAGGSGPARRVLDVGCGPGALTEVLVDRLGVGAVSAVDPSEAYVAATGRRLPGVDVRRASAEELPYDASSFDGALAQLVVHFMADPVAGLQEMARVTRPAGVVAACVWDNAGGRGPLSPLWRAAHELDPAVGDEGGAAGAREGQLAALAKDAGLVEVRSAELTVAVPFATFAEWWAPLTLGVGSGGAFVTGLEESRREALRARLETLLGPAPFVASATAWAVVGEVPAG